MAILSPPAVSHTPGSTVHFLERTYGEFHKREFLFSDPLEFPHRYKDAWDQEAVALVSALLAYGNVKQIRRSVEDALARMQDLAPSPSRFVRGLGDPMELKKAQRKFQGFVHRFNRGEDVVSLFQLLSRSWSRFGSLGAHFVSNLDPTDATIEGALSHLILNWKSWAREMKLRRGPFFAHLLNSPQDGSCCKRWCMFLRWMGRSCDLDLGLWSKEGALASTFSRRRWLRPDQLVIPLDTHTGRISQKLGLTSRKNLNWKAALEVTQALRAFDAVDPVRYDFALCRLGILG